MPCQLDLGEKKLMGERIDTASRLIAASPEAIYAAFVNAGRLMIWLPPTGMTGRALLFEPWEGGRYRIELTYDDPATAPGGAGKSDAASDIASGRFLTLEPGRAVVQTGEFESDDPAFAGIMTMRWTFAAEAGGTRVTVAATDVPSGITPEDHRDGMAASLANLARLLESGATDRH